ncbi:aspartic peptidase domain-containing protein [Trichoderma compactum]
MFLLWAAFIFMHLEFWVAAEDCVPGPISLSVANTTLSTTGKSQRGVSLKVGTPPQQFTFLPKWNNNNTFLYGPKCDSENLVKTDDACITFRGGIYGNTSDTRGVLASSIKPPKDLWSSTTYELFTDNVELNTNNSLHAFPLANPTDIKSWDTQAYDPQNIIGLGSGSTIIDACRKAGSIASDSVGFYWGLDGVLDKDQTKGSFVLGGYDRAKTFGDGYTIPLSDDPDCPTGMVVSIANIVLNFVNGTDFSLFPDSKGTILTACLIPERPTLMDMPRTPYFDSLLEAVGNEEFGRSTGIDWWNVILNPSKSMFTGDLTFTLDNNMDITIPNRQLIVPERYIDDNGALAINSSLPVIRINSLQNTTSHTLPNLGRYFLTAAYVLFNRDANEFTLWQANPTSDEDLVSVNDKNEVFEASQSCAKIPATSLPPATSMPSSGSDKGGKPDVSDNSSKSSSLSSGAIAGIAIGCAVIIAISLGVLWWCQILRRKSKTGMERSISQEQTYNADESFYQKHSPVMLQEMPSESRGVAELPS